MRAHHDRSNNAPQGEARLWGVALRKLDLIIKYLETVMIDTTALKTAAARAKRDNTELLAALTSVRDQNKTNAAALTAALEKLKNFPGDTTAIENDIAAVVTDLTQIAADSEAAVAANPGVPDMPAA